MFESLGRWIVSCAVMAVALGAAACAGEDPQSGPAYETGPDMFPGRNCLSCHTPDFGDPAPTWSAGGTVFESADSDLGVEGAVVTLTDKNGKIESATTAASGNFHFPAGLEPPFKVEVAYDGEVIEMPIEAPAGSCNACHTHPNPVGDAPGKIFPNQGRGEWEPAVSM